MNINGFSNRLLQGLSDETLAKLRPSLVRLEMRRRDPMTASGATIENVYFPESGVGSVVERIEGQTIEVGIFGLDGMSAPSLILGIDRAPHDTFMQIPGIVMRLPAALLRQAMSEDSAAARLFLNYAHCFSLQVAETAACNGLNSLDERLARWLLMCDDRTGGNDIEITHEFLSVMLGVRRPAVTLAVQALEGAGLLKAARGRVQVRDRSGLRALTGGAYGMAVAEYDRLFGPGGGQAPQHCRDVAA